MFKLQYTGLNKLITFTAAVINFDELPLLSVDASSPFTCQIYLKVVWLRKTEGLPRDDAENVEIVHLLVNILGKDLRVVFFF